MSLLCSLLRFQVLTRVVVRFNGCQVPLLARCCGGLTGSNVALTMARVPIESSVCDLYEESALRGFEREDLRLVFATYIDNIFAASSSPEDACLNLSNLFRLLSTKWGLSLKSGSACVICSKGCDLSRFRPEEGIPLVSEAVVLGWQICSNGSQRSGWKELIRKAWTCFWANCRARGWRSWGIKRRLRLLDRCVKPIVLHRLQVWGATKSGVKRLSRLQRHLVSRACGNFMLPCETFKAFFQRCSSESRLHIGKTVSDWSLAWCRSTLSWDMHLKRDWDAQSAFVAKYPQSRTILGRGVSGWTFRDIEETYATGFSWAAALHNFRAESFLASLRTTFSRSLVATSTRTGTRAARGYVEVRWHDSVAYCNEHVP